MTVIGSLQSKAFYDSMILFIMHVRYAKISIMLALAILAGNLIKKKLAILIKTVNYTKPTKNNPHTL